MIRIGYNKNDKKHPLWCYNIFQLFDISENKFISTRLEMCEVTFEDDETPDLDLSLEEVLIGRRRDHIWFNVHVSDREWRMKYNNGHRYLCFAFEISNEVLFYPNFTAEYIRADSETVKFMEHSINYLNCEKDGMETFECAFFIQRQNPKVIEIIK